MQKYNKLKPNKPIKLNPITKKKQNTYLGVQGACRFGGKKKCEVVHICICESQKPRDNQSPKYLPITQTDHIQKFYIWLRSN